eukprot:4784324-Amphidinium_carterae.1
MVTCAQHPTVLPEAADSQRVLSLVLFGALRISSMDMQRPGVTASGRATHYNLRSVTAQGSALYVCCWLIYLAEQPERRKTMHPAGHHLKSNLPALEAEVAGLTLPCIAHTGWHGVAGGCRPTSCINS